MTHYQGNYLKTEKLGNAQASQIPWCSVHFRTLRFGLQCSFVWVEILREWFICLLLFLPVISSFNSEHNTNSFFCHYAYLNEHSLLHTYKIVIISIHKKDSKTASEVAEFAKAKGIMRHYQMGFDVLWKLIYTYVTVITYYLFNPNMPVSA